MLDEIGARAFTKPKALRLTVHDLLEALKVDYGLRKKLSLQTASYFKRADNDFGDRLALALTPEQIDSYKTERLAKGNAPASIDRPLQLLVQAYSFALNRNHRSRVPCSTLLSEKGNVRRGFWEETAFRKVNGFLPEHLADFCLFAYVTGMRSGEVKSLKWRSKENNPRLIPMVGKDLARPRRR